MFSREDVISIVGFTIVGRVVSVAPMFTTTKNKSSQASFLPQLRESRGEEGDWNEVREFKVGLFGS